MIPAGPVLVAILSLPYCWADRADVRVPETLAKEAYAISEVANNVDEAAALVSIAKHESGNCLSVQDHYTGSGAQSWWQLEKKNNKYEQPFLGLTYKSIKNSAYAAVDIWRHSGGCPGGISGKFRVYGGRSCTEKFQTLNSRVALFWYARSVIVKEIRNEEKRRFNI